MTLAISVTVPEGIVLAADSRQTYAGGQGPRVGSDYGMKVFQLGPRVGATTWGWAFLKAKGMETSRNIHAFIGEFQADWKPSERVGEVAGRLAQYFLRKYEEHVEQGLDKPVPEGHHALGFWVAGYDPEVEVGEVYQVLIPGGSQLGRTTHSPGVNWRGQLDVVHRLVLGYDPRLTNTDLARELSPEEVRSALQGLEYRIHWGTLTLQDAIDLAALLIHTTIHVQRFTDGIMMAPGEIPGTGGPIDIAVITARDGFQWIQVKGLRGVSIKEE